MSRWYRAYQGTVTDPKLGEVAMIAECSRSIAIAAWHALLEDCAGTNDGGRFELTARRLAVILAEPVAVTTAIMNAFEEIGLTEGGSVSAWRDRQFENDRPEPNGASADITGNTTGYCYFAGIDWDHPVKVGYSKNPWARLANLQTGHHADLVLLGVVKGAAFSELDIHSALKPFRTKGEWFVIPPAVSAVIKGHVERKENDYPALVVELRATVADYRSSDRSSYATTTDTDTDTDTEKKEAASQTQAEASVAPPDPRAELFGRGLKQIVAMTGKAEPPARTLLGRWLRDCDDEAVIVLEAIDRAAENRPADPTAWISGVLRQRKQSRAPPSQKVWNTV